MICALFRTGTSDGLLWRRQWTFVFHKMRGVSRLALELLVSQEGAGTVGLVIWLDGTEFAELPQVLHTATTFFFRIWYPASSAVPTASLLGFVMIGCCLKLGCILHLFIIKLLVSVRFWSELPVHISSILFALVFMHISHHILCFFPATCVSTIFVILLFTLLYFSFCAFWIWEGPALPTYLDFLL